MRKIQLVVQHLPGVVKQRPAGFGDDPCQRQAFQPAAGQQFVQVVHIGLEVLAMVELQRPGRNDRLQRIQGIRKVDEFIHIVRFCSQYNIKLSP